MQIYVKKISCRLNKNDMVDILFSVLVTFAAVQICFWLDVKCGLAGQVPEVYKGFKVLSTMRQR